VCRHRTVVAIELLLKFTKEIGDIEIHDCRSIGRGSYFQTVKDLSRLMEECLSDDGGSRKMAGKIGMFRVDPSALAGRAENHDRVF
jgi:hypothetical protein